MVGSGEPSGSVGLRISQTAPSGGGRTALAVLPLRNLSGDPEQEYFSEGLTEELIGQLARIDPERLGIIARASAMKYRQSSKGISQIARELGVTYLLEGSVRRDGDRVRISAALIRASDQTSLWTDVYDRDLRDILKLQAEVAESVAREIALKVSSGERARLARSGPVDPRRSAPTCAGATCGIVELRRRFRRRSSVSRSRSRTLPATRRRMPASLTVTRS